MKKLDDKKKLMVLGAMAAVLLAVGAFQFMGSGPAPKPVTAEAGQEKPKDGAASEVASKDPKMEEDPVRAQILDLLNPTVSTRDPFMPSGQIAQDMTPPANPDTSQKPIPAPSTSGGGSRRGGSNFDSEGFKPWGPPTLQGELNPNGPKLVAAPSGNNTGSPNGGSAQSPDEFGYKVKGIIEGKTKMAVFEDQAGNQKLVPVGGSVDGDSVVEDVVDGKVKVKHRGKSKNIKIEEDRR